MLCNIKYKYISTIIILGLDAGMKAKLEPYAKLVHEAQKKPIGESKNVLKFEECTYGECALGNLITDANNELVS